MLIERDFKKFILTNLLIIMPIFALAGGAGPGGGDAVVKPGANPELLDFAEPQLKYLNPMNFEYIPIFVKCGFGGLSPAYSHSSTCAFMSEQYNQKVFPFINPYIISTPQEELGYAPSVINAIPGCQANGFSTEKCLTPANSVSLYFQVLLGGVPSTYEIPWDINRKYVGLSIEIDKFRWNKKAPQPLIFQLVNEPLEQIKDEGYIRNVDPKFMVQVAAQKDGVVLIYWPVFAKMDKENQAGLFIHEALVGLLLNTNPKHLIQHGTSKIRAYNSLLRLTWKEEFVPLNVLKEKFKELQVPSDLIQR